MPRTKRKTLTPDAVEQPVTIEYTGGTITVPAYIVPGARWNGWEQPWLPSESVDMLIRAFDPAAGDVKIVRSGLHGHVVTVHDEGYPDEPYTLTPDTMTTGGLLLWSWDTAWCWYVVEPVETDDDKTCDALGCAVVVQDPGAGVRCAAHAE